MRVDGNSGAAGKRCVIVFIIKEMIMRWLLDADATRLGLRLRAHWLCSCLPRGLSPAMSRAGFSRPQI